MQKPSFSKTPLAAGVALALGVTAAPASFAQEEAMEEVVVTGIRGSLQRSIPIVAVETADELLDEEYDMRRRRPVKQQRHLT